jgi:hypothetical protein
MHELLATTFMVLAASGCAASTTAPEVVDGPPPSSPTDEAGSIQVGPPPTLDLDPDQDPASDVLGFGRGLTDSVLRRGPGDPTGALFWLIFG